jgi:hypothetical protein
MVLDDDILKIPWSTEILENMHIPYHVSVHKSSQQSLDETNGWCEELFGPTPKE